MMAGLSDERVGCVGGTVDPACGAEASASCVRVCIVLVPTAIASNRSCD